jgi:hypothetical protein
LRQVTARVQAAAAELEVNSADHGDFRRPEEAAGSQVGDS